MVSQSEELINSRQGFGNRLRGVMGNEGRMIHNNRKNRLDSPLVSPSLRLSVSPSLADTIRAPGIETARDFLLRTLVRDARNFSGKIELKFIKSFYSRNNLHFEHENHFNPSNEFAFCNERNKEKCKMIPKIIFKSSLKFEWECECENENSHVFSDEKFPPPARAGAIARCQHQS